MTISKTGLNWLQKQDLPHWFDQQILVLHKWSLEPHGGKTHRGSYIIGNGDRLEGRHHGCPGRGVSVLRWRMHIPCHRDISCRRKFLCSSEQTTTACTWCRCRNHRSYPYLRITSASGHPWLLTEVLRTHGNNNWEGIAAKGIQREDNFMHERGNGVEGNLCEWDWEHSPCKGIDKMEEVVSWGVQDSQPTVRRPQNLTTSFERLAQTKLVRFVILR